MITTIKFRPALYAALANYTSDVIYDEASLAHLHLAKDDLFAIVSEVEDALGVDIEYEKVVIFANEASTVGALIKILAMLAK